MNLDDEKINAIVSEVMNHSGREAPTAETTSIGLGSKSSSARAAVLVEPEKLEV